jgi:hypothetical protein
MTDIHNSAQRARLFPWIIVRLLPNLQRITVGRFRHRSHAEGHLRVLKRVMPLAELAIAFDLMGESFDTPRPKSAGILVSQNNAL